MKRRLGVQIIDRMGDIKRLLVACWLLLGVGLVSETWAKAGDMPMATRNSVRLYGGVGYWGPYSDKIKTMYIPYPSGPGGYHYSEGSIKYYATAIYGFNYQRDLIRRFSVELDVQGSYRNTFPSAANTHIYDYPLQSYTKLDDMPEVREYISKWLGDGNDPRNFIWFRHSSMAITIRPVLHMIDNVHHRFSAYAGIGWYFVDGLRYTLDATYGSSLKQNHVSGLAGNVGLRYEYTFLEKFMVGLDLCVAFNDDGAPWKKDKLDTGFGSTDGRALIFIGFRL